MIEDETEYPLPSDMIRDLGLKAGDDLVFMATDNGVIIRKK